MTGKGMKIVNMERKSKSVGPSLSVEDTEYLKKNTKYSDEDIKIWFRSVSTFSWKASHDFI